MARGSARVGRVDRDGDMKMDGSSRGRGGRSAMSRKLGAHKELLVKDARIAKKPSAHRTSAKDAPRGPRTMTELKVTGWDKSKTTAQAKDGGLSTFMSWMEKKASLRLGSGKRDVKIKKSKVVDNVLFINVLSEDANALTRLNNFVWGGAQITVERVGGAVQSTAGLSSEAEKIKAMLKGVLERRFNPEDKFLDLSALGQDTELQAQNIFDQKSTTNKFFPAMMSILSKVFDTPAERDAAIESVSLANNELKDLQAVSTLSETLPKLHNLDLSNNKFENLEALGLWRRRLRDLQHLIVANNPLEKEPKNAAELMKWYPKLRMLNNVQVRTEEEAAQGTQVPATPFPIRSPLFQDEGGIAEKFVCTFFMGMDQDRPRLASIYYDENSEFSLALNTSAPRDPAGGKIESQDWARYIKISRNLKKITQPPARQRRLHRGTKAITEVLVELPASKHPDIRLEARKWLVEAYIQPGVPDMVGQNPGGVDGFCITVHTEFQELDGVPAKPGKTRSVDHVFIIAPGAGPEGIRIHSHMMAVRAYGGVQAFQPEDHGPPTPPQQASADNLDSAPQLPAGLTIAVAEQMVAELTKQTNMTLEYSKLCLEQTAWNFDSALAAFASVKATLPPSAYIQA